MATVRDIHDIREIFIEAVGSAYIHPGRVFDRIIQKHVEAENNKDERIYTQDDLDTATGEAYSRGYDDGYNDAKKGEGDGVH